MAQTPIQKAVALMLGTYQAALRTLTPAEADVLRDIVAARIARDYLEALGELGSEDVERAT